MNLVSLWWSGIFHPGEAFEGLKPKPAPAWGFWVVLVFNLLISTTTLLAQVLLGRGPLMPSVLTFLPDEKYLLAEMFFLPPLRILIWMMTSATTHLGLRLAGKPSDLDLLLNIGGLGYLVVMPFILASDWLLIALNAYALAEYTHPLAAVWGAVLAVIGMKKILGVETWLAVALALVGALVSIPFLAIFAR